MLHFVDVAHGHDLAHLADVNRLAEVLDVDAGPTAMRNACLGPFAGRRGFACHGLSPHCGSGVRSMTRTRRTTSVGQMLPRIRPPSEEDTFIRRVLALAATLSFPAQEKLRREWRLMPRPVVYADIGAWLRTAARLRAARVPAYRPASLSANNATVLA
jgi:hypothetical protein